MLRTIVFPGKIQAIEPSAESIMAIVPSDDIAMLEGVCRGGPSMIGVSLWELRSMDTNAGTELSQTYSTSRYVAMLTGRLYDDEKKNGLNSDRGTLPSGPIDCAKITPLLASATKTVAGPSPFEDTAMEEISLKEYFDGSC